MPPPLKVLLACSGLDHAHRGFETFARETFAELSDAPELDLVLVKGSGPVADRERRARTLLRDAPLARGLGRLTGREPFRFEHAAFAFSLQRELARRDPDVVYFSEWHTGVVLAKLRRALRARYKLVLSNGTMAASGFDHLDRVQDLTPVAHETVLALGADPRRHVLLPYGFAIAPTLAPVDRPALRRRLGLPTDRRVVLSVAALNDHHKRLHYLIDEFASLPQPRPFLLMAGQPETETPAIRRHAAAALGADGHDIRTVAPAEVESLYGAADVFVLASLGESLGRVLVEAQAAGLPCVVHDYPITRYVLGDHGRYGDFTQPGALARLLADPLSGDGADARHRHAYERFGWHALRPRYIDLLRSAVTG